MALGGTVWSPPSFLAWARCTRAVIGPVSPSVQVAPILNQSHGGISTGRAQDHAGFTWALPGHCIAPPRGPGTALVRVFWRWVRCPRRSRVGGEIDEDRDIDEPVQQRDAGRQWGRARGRASRRL